MRLTGSETWNDHKPSNRWFPLRGPKCPWVWWGCSTFAGEPAPARQCYLLMQLAGAILCHLLLRSIPEQGSLHNTPEHCLVNGGVLLLWRKNAMFQMGNIYLLRSPAEEPFATLSGKKQGSVFICYQRPWPSQPPPPPPPTLSRQSRGALSGRQKWCRNRDSSGAASASQGHSSCQRKRLEQAIGTRGQAMFPADRLFPESTIYRAYISYVAEAGIIYLHSRFARAHFHFKTSPRKIRLEMATKRRSQPKLDQRANLRLTSGAVVIGANCS